MESLSDALEVLERDLAARPPRIAAHSDMPFAVFVYPPAEEYTLRQHVRLLAIRLEADHARRVTFVSLSRLVWDVVKRQQGTEYLHKTETLRGFDSAQEHVNRLLSSPDFEPIAGLVGDMAKSLDPDRDVMFLMRTGGFSPSIYRCSVLLEGLRGRTLVPIVLFYPGSAGPGTDLRFYDITAHDTTGAYNYRVAVYGVRT